MGYKPKHFELKGPADLAKLAGPFFAAAIFTCGNCDNLIVFRHGSKRPIRCSKCGEDIDWSEDLSGKKILFCPQCGRADFQLDVPSIPAKVKLKLTEVVG